MQLGISGKKVEPNEARIKRMAELLSGMFKKSIMQQKATLDVKLADINSYTNAITSMLAQATACRQTMQALTEKSERIKAEGSRVIEGLLGLPKVKDVNVQGDMVTIDTEHLDFTYKGRVHKGHAYRIVMSPARGAMIIKALDIGKTIDGYIHPHVNSQGVPCLGNIKTGVVKFLTELEFVPLTVLLMEYLQIANDTDWYIDPMKWPLVGVEEAVKIEGAVPVATVVDEEPEEEDEQHYCPGCGAYYDDDYWCDECGHCNDCCTCHGEDEESESDEEEEP